MNESQNKVPLSAFFEAVERRLSRKFPGKWKSFQVEVAGKVIELRFASPADAEYASMGLRGRIVRLEGNPHAVFKYWQDRCDEYVGEENVSARWKKQEEEGFIAYYIKQGFLCADYEKEVFYCCDDVRNGNTMLFMHALNMVFYQWAFSEGMMMLHSAAVGVNGVGVLIAGRSGAGKSTLSAACMLAGMEVVGDDYVVLTGSGEHRAVPLYSSVCLNQDICNLLNPDMRTMEIAPSGKRALDASAYLCPTGIIIKCLITPVKCEDAIPELRPVPSGPVITRVVHSTLQQAGYSREVEQVRQMAGRLSGLPAYEFHQCRDLHKNAEFLREFIIKEL